MPHNQIRIPQNIQPLIGDFAQDPNGQARPGEGLPLHDLFGQAEGPAHLAYFIFEQLPQRFHQLEAQVVWQPAHVVVALDFHGNALAGFGIHVGVRRLNHVGVQGSLRQVIEGAQAGGFFFKDGNEFMANDFALLLRIGNSIHGIDEAATGVDIFHGNVKFLLEQLQQALWLAFAHEALVNEHAGEVVPDRLVQQKGQGGRVNPARQGQQHPLIAHAGPHFAHGLFHKGFRGPGGLAMADVINKVAN